MKKVVVIGDGGFISKHVCEHMLLHEYGATLIIEHSNASCSYESARQVRFTLNDLGEAFKEEAPDYIINCCDIAPAKRNDGVSHCTHILNNDLISSAASLYWQHLSDEECDTESVSFKYIDIVPYAVYGGLIGEGAFDERSRYAPSSLYAAAAAASNILVSARGANLPFITIVHSSVYGYGQDTDHSMVSYVIDRILERKAILLSGNGKHTRDFIYIKDFCDGILLVVQKGKNGEQYCIGSGREMTLVEATEVICNVVNSMDLKLGLDSDSTSLIKFGGGRSSRDRRRALSCTKAQRELGFRQQYSLKEGIEDLIGQFVSCTEYNA